VEALRASTSSVNQALFKGLARGGRGTAPGRAARLYAALTLFR
jgi:hypothetical protein